MPVARLASVSN